MWNVTLPHSETWGQRPSALMGRFCLGMSLPSADHPVSAWFLVSLLPILVARILVLCLEEKWEMKKKLGVADPVSRSRFQACWGSSVLVQ